MGRKIHNVIVAIIIATYPYTDFIIIIFIISPLYKESALHKAIKEGHAAVVKSLLDDGADFHAIDKVNCLFNARVECCREQYEVLQSILNAILMFACDIIISSISLY